VPRYRFQAAETLKQAERAAAALELAQTEHALAAAQKDAAEAQRALAAHAAAVPAEVALDPGVARAFELQRAAAFAERHAETTRALRAELARIEAQAGLLEAAVLRSRSALARAHEGEQAIERDRERFARDQRKRSEHHEQRELEEQRGGDPNARDRR
jgi:hypothetical protein